MHDGLIATLAGRIAQGGGRGWTTRADLDEAGRLLATAQPRATQARAWLSVCPEGRAIDFNARAGALLGLEAQGDLLPGLATQLDRATTGREVVLMPALTGISLTFQAVKLPDGRIWQLDEAPSPASAWLRATMMACWHLTPGEADMAEALLTGQSSEMIAKATGRTVGTVRQVIKMVLSKMGAGSQAQAVARLAALAVARAGLGPGSPDLPAQRRLLRPAGRPSSPLSCWRFGDPGGRPVLFLHGALFGVVGRAAMATEARLFGLDVIAPERPGYGETPLPEGADPVALAAAQALALLDDLGIGRAQVITHDVGSVTGFALARAAPERVASLICAPATPPMLGWAQTADMPPLHRVSALAAQAAPALMEKLVLLGLRRIAREGLAAIPRLVFADSDHDREVMLRPDALPVLEHLHRFALEQGARGFIQDMFVTNRNWSDWLPGITCPVLLMHGARSHTVSLRALETMASMLPDARIDLIADAGHTLPVSHPVHAFRAALRMAG